MRGEGLVAGRLRVGYLVSRETGGMEEGEVVVATLESLLENGCDAIFGVLFWFLLLGAEGALLYRLVNTLDALWGYRNERYFSYGWGAARLDELLNWVPARLTAVTYLLVGSWLGGWRGWRGCRVRKSPNATLVMAVGAGALGVQLGGVAVYGGVRVENPLLGVGPRPVLGDIERGVLLVRRSVWLWAVFSLVLVVAGNFV